jgi:hypothetical protein
MTTFCRKLFSVIAICSAGTLLSCEKSKSGSADVGSGGGQHINPKLILQVLVDSSRNDVNFIYSLGGPERAEVAGFSPERKLACTNTFQSVAFYYDPSNDQAGHDDWIELCEVDVPSAPCDTKILKIAYRLSDPVTASCEISDKS